MLKEAVLEATLDGLTHLLVGIDDRRQTVWEKTTIDTFDGFEILDPNISGEDDFVLLGAPSDAPVWPMDAVWGGHFDYEENQSRTSGWMFKRVNTLNPRNWRGRLKRVLPRMVEHHECHVNPQGVATSSVAPLLLLKDKVGMAAARSHPMAGIRVGLGSIYGTDFSESNTDQETLDVCISHGIMLRREYLWSVLLGEAGIPRARFVTDPVGVREVFRLRDIPPGRARRAALRHWVSQHWRKSGRESEADKAWVRAHLRGAVDFGWSGFSCRIEPSREDLRRSDDLGTSRAKACQMK